MGPLKDRTPGPGAVGAAVLARGLAFRYPGGRVGLEPLELRVEPGEVVVVLGPNGSGKSTLLRLLATDLPPGEGELNLLGLPAVPPTPALRRRIAWVPDRPVHLEPLTGFENLSFFQALGGSPGTRGGKDPGDANREGHGLPPSRSAEALLDIFGLSPVAHVPVSRYSFGMRRRLALAEALATAPELLLLDEPTVGLDPQGVGVLGERVREAARGGTAVMIASNEVRAAPEWATRILFLHQGRVIEDGSPGELRARIPGGARIRVGFQEAERDSTGFSDQGISPWAGVAGRLTGVSLLEAGAEHLIVRAEDGGRTLPVLLQALVEEGARVREVTVREPDLGDLFRELTGRELGPGEDSWGTSGPRDAGAPDSAARESAARESGPAGDSGPARDSAESEGAPEQAP